MNNNLQNMQDYCDFIRDKLSLSIPVNVFTLIDNDAMYYEGTIFYDKDRSRQNINFSLAREIGKLLLNEYDAKILNDFAAELLMPKAEFYSIIYNDPEEKNFVEMKKLAKYFGVTTHMINTRGQVLNLWK